MIKLNSFYEKEIISIIDGTRLGEISDIEIEESSGKIISLILTGKLRFFGLFGRKDPIIVPWESVRVIGEETVLVDVKTDINYSNKHGIIRSFLD
ncbi:MAG: YlmC/YmxH family sporulation protein [Acutalibacteraceae bacterium]|nr:YlmC/YmxH family sporulation protein [Acutalibacteraceae bacterium]